MLSCEDGMSSPDEECVRSCLDGHPEAFRFLVDRHQTALMKRLHVRLGDAEKVTEVAQEAFVRAYFALRNLQKPAAFFPWLVGIADRVVKETFRAAKRRRTVALSDVGEADPAEKRDVSPDPEVTNAIAALPGVYREVIVLRFYEGQSCDKISRRLDVPLGTVTKRLSRAYGLLRERLRPSADDQESEVSP
jgi:RNA polymerase sigma-70 factor, ECF subfamily